MTPHDVCAKEECAVSVIPDIVFQLPTVKTQFTHFCLHTVCYAPSSCFVLFCFFLSFFSEKAASAMLYNMQSYHQNLYLFRFW